MIVGGRSDGHSAISDCWIHDLTTMKWKKVAHVYVYVSDIIYVVFWSSAAGKSRWVSTTQ